MAVRVLGLLSNLAAHTALALVAFLVAPIICGNYWAGFVRPLVLAFNRKVRFVASLQRLVTHPTCLLAPSKPQVAIPRRAVPEVIVADCAMMLDSARLLTTVVVALPARHLSIATHGKGNGYEGSKIQEPHAVLL